MNATMTDAVMDRTRRVAHLDLAGAGQVYVSGDYCYIGHIPNKEMLGATILDISDPANPRIAATITQEEPDSHSHKARVIGDLMIVNHELNTFGIGRKAEQLPPVRAQLREVLGRDPNDGELAERLGMDVADFPNMIEAEKNPYDRGKFKIYDVSDPSRPSLLHYQKTGGKGVHRFDMDDRYAYISTEMDGYRVNILVNYDISDPTSPKEVSRWWMPGQHIAGGEKPDWVGKQNRLHHALRFGDKLWAGVWHAGLRVIDVADMTAPKTVGAYNYYPPFPEPTHTVMPVTGEVGGRQILLAIDEKDQYYNPEEAQKRKGRPHANLWVFDIGNLDEIKPLSIFQVSEMESPLIREPNSRFGAHQFHERMKGTLVYCTWFSGGMRIVDVGDPLAPQEVGSFVPESVNGQPAPQTNDVNVDDRGLIHIVDRNAGYDIVKYEG